MSVHLSSFVTYTFSKFPYEKFTLKVEHKWKGILETRAVAKLDLVYIWIFLIVYSPEPKVSDSLRLLCVLFSPLASTYGFFSRYLSLPLPPSLSLYSLSLSSISFLAFIFCFSRGSDEKRMQEIGKYDLFLEKIFSSKKKRY